MTFGFLDIFVIGVLLFVIVGIMIGRGEDILRLFNSKKDVPGAPKYDTHKEIKAVLVFCLFMLGCEVVMKLGDIYGRHLYIIAIVLIILDVIGVIYYLRKYARID